VASIPVIVFAYNRPQHLHRCLASLAQSELASSSDLYVFVDGPRRLSDEPAVQQSIQVAKSVTAFRSASVTSQVTNIGLAESVIRGVSAVLADHDSAIVVEDDLVLSPGFLPYMHAGLRVYADVDRVASIHGYCYPVRGDLPETFFLRGADCWGWATWADRWASINFNASQLLAQIVESGLQNRFDFQGTYPYTQMLEDQVRGLVDSWAIRWHASVFLQNRLTLYPGRSLVMNAGQDGSGTHSGDSVVHGSQLALESPTVQYQAPEESQDAFNAFAGYFKSLRRRRNLSRSVAFLRSPKSVINRYVSGTRNAK
jgi:hypothetical protein